MHKFSTNRESKLADITSNIRSSPYFLFSTYKQRRNLSIMYLCTKFHMASLNGFLGFFMKSKAEENIYMAVILLFYLPQNIIIITAPFVCKTYYYTSFEDPYKMGSSRLPYCYYLLYEIETYCNWVASSCLIS
jgi:hypothetical protein